MYSLPQDGIKYTFFSLLFNFPSLSFSFLRLLYVMWTGNFLTLIRKNSLIYWHWKYFFLDWNNESQRFLLLLSSSWLYDEQLNANERESESEIIIMQKIWRHLDMSERLDGKLPHHRQSIINGLVSGRMRNEYMDF